MKLKKLIRALIILSLPLSSTVTLFSCVTPQKKDISKENDKDTITTIKPVIEENKSRNKWDVLGSIINLYLNRKNKNGLKNDYDNLKDDLSKIDLKKFVSEMISPILSMIAKVPVSAKEVLEKIKEANLKDFTTAFNGFLTGKITVLKDSVAIKKSYTNGFLNGTSTSTKDDNFINVDANELFKNDYLKWLDDQKELYKKKIKNQEFNYEKYRNKLISDQKNIDSSITRKFKEFSDNHYWKWREYVDSNKLINAYLNSGQYEELWHKDLLKPLLDKLKDDENFHNYQFRITSDYEGWILSNNYWTEIEYRTSESEKWIPHGSTGKNNQNKKNNEILRARTKEKYLAILKRQGKIEKFHYSYFDTPSGKTGVFDSDKTKSIYEKVNKNIEDINNLWIKKNEKLLENNEFRDKLIEQWDADNQEEAIKKIEYKYNSGNMEFFSHFINQRVQSFTSEKLSEALRIQDFVSIDIANLDSEPKIDKEKLKNNIFENNNLIYIISSILNIIKVAILDKSIEEPITKIDGSDFSKIINTLKYWFNPVDFSNRFTSEIFSKLYPFLKDIKIKLINLKSAVPKAIRWFVPDTKILSLENLHTGSGDFLVDIADLIGKMPNIEWILNKEIAKLLPDINEHLDKVDVKIVSKYFDDIDIVKVANVITKMNEQGTSLIDILKDINNLFNINDDSTENSILLINKLLSYLKQILSNLSKIDLEGQKHFFSIIKSISKSLIDEKHHAVINEVFTFVNPGLLQTNYIDLIDLLGRIMVGLIKLSEKKDLSVKDFLEIYKDINKLTGSDKEISDDLLKELEILIKDKQKELDLSSFELILQILKGILKK